jgi:hypothetical protein
VTGDTFNVVDSSKNAGLSSPDSASGKHFQRLCPRTGSLSMYFILARDSRCTAAFFVVRHASRLCIDIGATDSMRRRLAAKANASNVFQIDYRSDSPSGHRQSYDHTR